MIDQSEVEPEVRFLAYFRSSRLLKVGLVFNISYYLIVVLVFLILSWSDQLENTVYYFDWNVFYEAGQILHVSPEDLYTVNPNGLPYRYFPAFAMIMSVLTWIPLEVSYFLNISLMMVMNWATLWMAYQVCISSGVSIRTRNFEKTLFFIYIAPQHIVNLILGQISQLVILLVLYVVLLLQKKEKGSLKRFLVVGLLIGLAFNFKPFILLFIPFLVPVYRSSKYSVEVSAKAIFGVTLGILLLLTPNIMFFMNFPDSFADFIRVNFIETLDYHHSTSITRLFTAAIPVFREAVPKFALIVFLGGFLFFRSYRRFIGIPNPEKQYTHHFAEGTFILLLVYPDSWFLFLAIWYSLLGPSILILYNENKAQPKTEKLLDTLWSGANNLLGFFTIGVILYYIVLGFDPVIPSWLVILYILHQKSLNNLTPNQFNKKKRRQKEGD